jgi:LemA protein
LSYNNKCKTFPGNLFAGIYGFKEKQYLQIVEADRKPVKVQF